METPRSLSRFPVRLTLPVQWGDMDAFAHVNNVMYLRWFETARIAYFERLAAGTKWNFSTVRPILARATVDYRLPITFPDTVELAATVVKLGNTSITMAYRAHSQRQGSALAAEGEAIVVWLDAVSGAKIALPAELQEGIWALEATA